MAGRVLSFPRTASVSRTLDIGPFCDSSTTSTRESLASRSGTTMESRASAMGLGCVRGTTLALSFEVAAGLVIYVAWRLIHLWQ